MSNLPLCHSVSIQYTDVNKQSVRFPLGRPKKHAEHSRKLLQILLSRGLFSAAVAVFLSSVNVAVCAWYVSCRCARAAGSTCTIEPQSTTVDSPSSHKPQTRACRDWISSSKRLSHCLTRKLLRQNRLFTELDLCTCTNQRES